PGHGRRGGTVRGRRPPQLARHRADRSRARRAGRRAPPDRHRPRRLCAALAARSEAWVWELLADLAHGRRRSAFDALVQSTAQALTTIDDGRDDPPVRITGPLPEDAIDILVANLEFREAGGRTRGPFRAAVQ